jgi:hypothetical protein
MKKAVWWLVVPILCIGGCLRIETHEEEGFVQISGGWINARTNNGKSVQFEIENGTNRPTLVRIHVEEGASVSAR